MQLQISKSKNAESFYVIKSYRDKATGKNTSKVVEKLGTRAELQAKLGEDTDVEAWARARVRALTEQEKADTRKVMVAFDPTRLIEANKRRTFNGGYLFLQAIYHKLGLHDICRDIARKGEFSYNLDAILSRLVYGRILHPASKAATFEFAQGLIERPAFDQHHIYRALDVLSKNVDTIQAALYKTSSRIASRKCGVLYYDCTNFFFEIESEDGFRRFGPSKEHRPNPLVQMGLFMDAEGMPLAFRIDNGAQSEQIGMTPLEEKIVADFGLSKFVVCTDSGLSSAANRLFNTKGERQFITTQSVKKLKREQKAWATGKKGWKVAGASGVFNLDEVQKLLDDEKTAPEVRASLKSRIFYKTRATTEKVAGTDEAFDQNLLVTFSFKYRDYLRAIRASQIERAKRAIARGAASATKKRSTDYKRFIKQTSVTSDGEVADEVAFALDAEAIAKEEAYDGFYCLATSFADDDVSALLKVAQRRWEIEECFRIMKTEFKARPVYLSREERIRAHFLTCFVALLIYRILEKKLKEHFTCDDIISTLAHMDFEEVPGEGYRPLYTRTEVTDALHEAFGFRTDYEILTNRTMRKIFKQTKSR